MEFELRQPITARFIYEKNGEQLVKDNQFDYKFAIDDDIERAGIYLLYAAKNHFKMANESAEEESEELGTLVDAECLIGDALDLETGSPVLAPTIFLYRAISNTVADLVSSHVHEYYGHMILHRMGLGVYSYPLFRIVGSQWRNEYAVNHMVNPCWTGMSFKQTYETFAKYPFGSHTVILNRDVLMEVMHDANAGTGMHYDHTHFSRFISIYFDQLLFNRGTKEIENCQATYFWQSLNEFGAMKSEDAIEYLEDMERTVPIKKGVTTHGIYRPTLWQKE